MTTKRSTEVPEKNEFLLNELLICVRVTEEKVTGKSHDKKRDETHISTRNVRDDEKVVSCPIKSLTKKDSGETVSTERINEIAFDHGFKDAERVDYDTVEYVIGEDVFVGEYDMSNVDNI